MNKTEIKIIPTPQKAVFGAKDCTVNRCIKTNHQEFEKYLDVFTQAASKIYKADFCIGDDGIELAFDSKVKAGAYKMSVNGKSFVISASDTEGVLYGIASALQYIKIAEDGKVSVKSVEIEDYPEKPFRGLMFSNCLWYPVRAVLRYIDICFLFKINYLHIHFGDNSYYTLPSTKYPKLNRQGMFYSEEDIKCISEYAKLRGITIIPEVETPGHTKIFNKTYPHIFSCELVEDDARTVSEMGTVITSENIICAGSEASINAVFDLVDETCRLFPDTPFIHIGGDEANIESWGKCNQCRKYMQEHDIEDVYELYSEFVGRVADRVLKNGKTPVVWEGFPEKGMKYIPKETVVIQWESHYNKAQTLLDEGFKLINASWKPLYIVNHYVENWGPFEIMDWNVHNWQHWWNKSDAYLNPVNVQPTDNVLGAEICVWGLPYERAVNRVIDNLAALSERTWTTDRVCSKHEIHLKLIEVCDIAGRLIQDI